MAHARLRPHLLVEEPQVGARWDVERRSRISLSALAYERIEDLIARCEPRSGCSLMMQDLQNLTESVTIDCHLEVLAPVASRNVTTSFEATDALMGFIKPMFDAMAREINPAQLDCRASPNFQT